MMQQSDLFQYASSAAARGKQRKFLRKSALLLCAVVLGLLAGVGYWQRGVLQPWLTDAIAQASGAQLRHVLVNGAMYTSSADLQQAIGVQQGEPLVGISSADIRAALEDLPWVRLAMVERRLPDTLYLELYEHEPIARLEIAGEQWVINKAGDQLVPSADAFQGLPLLSGPGAEVAAASLFALLQDYPNVLGQLAAAVWVGERRWDLALRSGVTVKLPEVNPQLALQYLAHLEQQRHILSLTHGTVDLRLPGRITFHIPDNALAAAVLSPILGVN